MAAPALSRRAQFRLENELGARYSISGTFYDAEANPDGTINLCTAENSLLSKELCEFMNSHCQITSSHLKYRSSLTKGFVTSTIQALPLYINDYAKPSVPVTPDHIVIGPGQGSLIAQFMWAVCDPGDGVLLTTPFYDDYRRDIIYPARAQVVLAHIPAEVDSLSLACVPFLRTTIKESTENGTRIRVLLLCNPHNPMARAYPEDTILAYARLAEEFDLHLLVDEVFANQFFPSSYVPQPQPMISVLSLPVTSPGNDLGVNPARIHVLASPTKAFGASGLKLGAFVSQHDSAVRAMVAAGLAATPVSSAADALFTQVLMHGRDGADAELGTFARWFLNENTKRLTRAFELVGAWCDFHGIRFTPASAGVFFLIDLDSVMPTSTPDGRRLSDQERVDDAVKVMLDAGVFLKPTTSYADPVKTRFRMTFTLPQKTMLIALHRIEAAFGLPTWPGLDQ